MDKAPEAPRGRRRILVGVIAAVVVAVVGGVLVVRSSKGSRASSRPRAALPVPTTRPYNARPGPGGSRILTEAVDPLTLAVPAAWISPAADSSLADEIDKLAPQAPPLAGLLHAEAQVASKSAIRLFAFQPAAPNAFVSVVSFSTPGATSLTPDAVAGIVARAKKLTQTVAVSGVQLPVGLVLMLQSSFVSQNAHVVVEVLVLIAGGRTVEVEMVSETNVAAFPPVFDQIAQSLRLS